MYIGMISWLKFLEPFQKSQNMTIHYHQCFRCTELQKKKKKKKKKKEKKKTRKNIYKIILRACTTLLNTSICDF